MLDSWYSRRKRSTLILCGNFPAVVSLAKFGYVKKLSASYPRRIWLVYCMYDLPFTSQSRDNYMLGIGILSHKMQPLQKAPPSCSFTYYKNVIHQAGADRQVNFWFLEFLEWFGSYIHVSLAVERNHISIGQLTRNEDNWRERKLVCPRPRWGALFAAGRQNAYNFWSA